MRTHWKRSLPYIGVTCLLAATLPVLGASAAPTTSNQAIKPTTIIRSGTAAPLDPDADLSVNSLPSGYEFRTIQMNLCNSGEAWCYDFPDEVPIREAQQIIRDRAPALVTLNEVCENNVRDQLSPVFHEAHPNDWTFWAFMPVINEDTGEAYRCKYNGERFGNGMLGRMFATSDNPELDAYGMPYPEEIQAPSGNKRSWLCVNPDDNYWGCTTHLASESETKAMEQCEYLMDGVIVYIWAADIRLPTVVGGDFNLEYGDSDNDVQDCVPSGWYRKGDGSVQHIMATNDLEFDYSEEIPIVPDTGHDAWLVAVTTP